MRILMLGAGAMGSLLGARLSGTQAQVTLFSTNRPHMEAIDQQGLTIQELDGSPRRYPLHCLHDPRLLREPPDLVIVMVKSYATEHAVHRIQPHC